ncbi:MAG: transcription-repair coupling factor [Actinobacteria bacterium]|nr:transcription-repair coupling factor [Cyanobacteriota bacterium]MCL5771234.1 transcription-repair coupling factor [Actinomycetota bacterium]
MFLNNFLKEKNWKEFYKNPKTNIYASENIWPFIIEGLSGLYNAPFIVITSTFDKSLELIEDIKCISNGNKDYYNYPHLGEGIFFKNKQISSQNLSDRLNILKKIHTYDKNENPFIIISSVSSFINLMPKNLTENLADLSFFKGKKYNRDTLIENFIKLGYERVHKVYDKGEFSIRGDIIDFFDITAANPVRLDFFDENLEHISYFDILSQKILLEINEIILTPNFNPWKLPEKKDIYKSKNEIKNEKYISLLELLKERNNKFGLVICDPLEVYLKLKSEIEIIEKSIESQKDNLINEDISFIKKYIPDKNFLENEIIDLKFNIYSSFKDLTEENDFVFNEIKIQKQNYGNPGAFIENLKMDINKNKKIFISLDNNERIKKIQDLLSEASIAFNVIKENKGIEFLEIESKVINLLNAKLYRGYESENYSIYGELDIYEQLGARDEKSLKLFSKSYGEFIPGDYVVHKAHGIGRYIDIVSENINGIKKDYFLIEYAGKDKLYVPVWQAERLHKYIGDGEPAVTSLNSKQWDNLKTKVRKSVKVLAVNLAKLYAEREKVEGFAFSEDSPWQKEIEDLFPFNETEDQLKAIKYVKEKMEEPKPMDILLCGDVGFGKTEVAIRASFKAMENGKQVLMLVPTTILADQHYNNFKVRFENYPVRVEVLSRFKSKTEQKEIVKDFSEGKIDMLIGTHRILQDDIKPKDLGLLIIDEEQRFGVNAKEKLKLLKKNIDVLTLTATPIPRTLYMSLTGIRDIVLMETYPENRHPIKTFVGRKNNMIIKMAIERELNRGGQVYYVSDRIIGIEHLCYELKKLIPQAKIAITHGQMEGKEIEKIMQNFVIGKYNILLTTSIIESGMDIPNVNTLIVENAQRFGLSQLYQLRGRVGRSSERAYAYFFYNERDNLTLNALERLKAIDEYTELGSGYNIAMKDLEIRGAGELLGANQHGHMNSVGFDLYCEIIREEIEKLKGNELKEDYNILIELPVSAYIPKTFIKNENERINIYKTLANSANIDDINKLQNKISERFGIIPAVFENLINIAKIKILLKSKNIEKINYVKNKGIIIKPVNISRERALNINKKNKNIIYNFKDKSIIINTLSANIKMDNILSIINDIINVI